MRLRREDTKMTETSMRARERTTGLELLLAGPGALQFFDLVDLSSISLSYHSPRTLFSYLNQFGFLRFKSYKPSWEESSPLIMTQMRINHKNPKLI